MKKGKKLLSIGMVLLLLFLVFTGCTKSNDKQDNKENNTTKETAEPAEQTEPPQPQMEYTFLDTVHATAPFGYNNPNDVVTPWIEEKLNMKVGEVTFAAGQSPMERINMLVAAGNLPDVVLIDNPDVSLAYQTGAFADLSQYKDLMINTDKYVTDVAWNMLKVGDKLVALPTGAEIDLGNPDVKALVDKNIAYRPTSNWGLLMREDILKQLGYKFKTLKEIQEDLNKNPRKLTDADLALEPAISTPEDFEKLLYDIKKLDLKVNGKPVIPLAIPDWGVYHISALYAPTGGYAIDPSTMEVTGYINNPNMKEYYSQLRKWFKDGVLDNDYLIQKPEQLQEKVASGRVAVLFFTPDTNAARDNLKKNNPDSELRPVPWPKSKYELETGRPSYVDPSYPAGFYNIMINKNVKDIPRLLKYLDWFQTEEAMDVSVLGPESGGLWEMKDGKKMFKDQELMDAIMNNQKTADGKNAEYYGLYDRNNLITGYTSKAFLTAPGPFYNNKIYEVYPVNKFDAYTDMWNYVSSVKLSRDGLVLPAGGEKSSATANYYWSTFRTSKTVELLSTKDEAEFDKAWDNAVVDFNEKSGYNDAIQEMTPLFKRALGK